MNPKPLLKQFPELEHLPTARREALLLTAHKEVTGPDRRLETWRTNLLSLAVISAITLIAVIWVGPALGLSGPATAVVIMVVVLPAFIYVQQRRYVHRLKPVVARLLQNENGNSA